ncbi:DUF6053 domain-containing protein [Lysobacter enzymogenes]
MGGASAPRLCAPVAATWIKGVGTEVPPTRAAARGGGPGAAPGRRRSV